MKCWDKDDLRILRERYAGVTNEHLAKILHRSPQAVAVKAHKMGLHKDEVFLARQGFQKGYTPFNKGRKMDEWLSPEVHEKIKANQARTADRNRAAALPDGTITRRYDGYHIKIEGQWVKMSHHVWVQHNGSIPEGMGVFHRDSDRYNTEIGNLYIDVKNNASAMLKQKSREERSAIGRKAWCSRRRKQAEHEARKNAELDHIFAEIHKSENNIYYQPKI